MIFSMDCRTARKLMDCLQDEAGTLDGQVLDAESIQIHRDALGHVETCPACQMFLEEWRHFDRRLYSMFMSSPVPAGLEDRLLQEVASQFRSQSPVPSPIPDSPIPDSPSRRNWIRSRAGWIVSAALLILIGIWTGSNWFAEEQLNFSGADNLLASHFLKGGTAWEDLDEFDGSFDLGNIQNDLGNLKISAPRGIDLGGGRGQDAAVFHFGLKNWSGVLTVLPTQHFTGLPPGASPSVQAGRSVLQWRSSDGKLTYILFVHKGSAADLAQVLFGLLT